MICGLRKLYIPVVHTAFVVSGVVCHPCRIGSDLDAAQRLLRADGWSLGSQTSRDVLSLDAEGDSGPSEWD